jgi:hypothetical protein
MENERKLFGWLAVALLMAGLVAAVALPAGASEKAPQTTDYKKKGFFLGGELAGLVGFADGDVIGAPGKLDFLVGYQINPYVSIGADLWTFWFVAYAAEAHVKANFTDTKISPYAVGTAGVVGIVNVFDDEEEGLALFTYSAGFGADFHLWKQGTLFTEVKYRGGTAFTKEDLSGTARGVEVGVGFRWTL